MTATQKQEQTAAILAAMKPASNKGPRVYTNRVYTRHFPDVEALVGVSLPPQALTLVSAILSDTVDTWTEPELHDLVTSLKDSLKTKQSPWLIFKYYRTKLVDAGVLSYETVD